MSAPGPGSVENTAAILKTICGRSANGGNSACLHDHMGEAAGLVNQIRIATYRDLAGTQEAHIIEDWLRGIADELERQVTG